MRTHDSAVNKASVYSISVPELSEAHVDERMDILRALEMSRIQYMKEQGILSDENRYR